MSDDLLDWPEETYDGDDFDDIDAELYVKPKKLKAARARRKLERLWERKRLAENLYDVFAETMPTRKKRAPDLSAARSPMTLVQTSPTKLSYQQQPQRRHAVTQYGHSEVA